jgi:hypothetical protein
LARAHQDVTFNFGKRPFVFNIDAYILDFQVPPSSLHGDVLVACHVS